MDTEIDHDQIDVEILEMCRLADLVHFRIEREEMACLDREHEIGGSE